MNSLPSHALHRTPARRLPRALAALTTLPAVTALALAAGAACAQTLYAPSLAEYDNSTSVLQLGLSNVHASGILGQNVIVAQLDSGLNRANPEFAGNSRILQGYNATNGTTDITDTMGHGTHVAGIIAAGGNGSGMYGVAPAARLLPIKVFGSNGTASGADIDKGLSYARSMGARVVNMSLAAGGPTGTTALKTIASTNNIVVVVAAGNNGLADPVWPARYAKESWANGTMIAVGAVDASRNIASFSNRAGDTANFYLVAPGVNIMSTYGTGYATSSGTSMAAPAVAGAAALITGYWPYLKANQVAAIMLNTADDLGAPGVDAVYGHGMLNVNRALSPQGSFTYTTAAGTSTTIALSGKAVVSSQPKVASPSAFSGFTTQVFDDYGRNYTSDEGQALTVHSQMTVDSVMGRSDRMLDAAERALPGGARFMSLRSRPTSVLGPISSAALNPSGQPIGQAAWRQTLLDSSASMMQLTLASGHSFSAGDGGLSGMSLGLMDSSLAPRLAGAEGVLANPLMGFAPDHRFASLSTPLTSGWSARLAVVRSKAYDQAHGDVNVVELTHQGRRHALNLSFGAMAEQGFLGGYSNAAMGLAQSTSTQGVTLSGAWVLNRQWTMAGSYSVSRTAAPQASGLLIAATGVKANGFGLGLVKADTWRDGDRLSFTVNAPLSARSGSLTYSVVDSVDPDTGAPHYSQRTVDLKPRAREWVAETRYVTRLSVNSSVTAVAALRQNPDNDATAPSQVVMGLRYNRSF